MIEKVKEGPVQLISLLVYVGVTVIVETSGEVPAKLGKLGIFPFPEASKPVAVLSFTHSYVVVPSVFVVVNTISAVSSPLHTTIEVT